MGLPSGDGSGAGEAAKDGRSSEGPLAVEVACRVCITGSEADGPAGVEEAAGDGPAAERAGVGAAAAGAGSGAGALTVAAAALFPAFCKASIKSSLAPRSWNFLARLGFIWKLTPRCSTMGIILLDELPSRSSVTLSVDSGWSGGAAARHSKHAIISTAIPTTHCLVRFELDFIAESLSLPTLPTLRTES